ncbi:hypothetical protein LSH36_1027g01004, partial [Paralvinella palmiformis]
MISFSSMAGVQDLFGILAIIILRMTADCESLASTKKELRLCNITLDWTSFSEPVLIRLPDIRFGLLGR